MSNHKNLLDNIIYIMTTVNDLHDASNGEVFGSISTTEFNQAMEHMHRHLIAGSQDAPLSTAILHTMFNFMTDIAIDSGEPLPAAPNVIGETVYELIVKHNEDTQLAEEVSDIAFELASALVEEPGRYR